MKKNTSALLAFLMILLYSCNTEVSLPPSPTTDDTENASPMDRLPKNEAGNMVRKAIEYVGGWEAWENKKTFSFYKNITILDSTGQIERSQKQLHQYQLQPQFKARMSWESDGKQYMIINNGEQAKKYEDGLELTDEISKNQAWNSSFGSSFVVSMPFKLTDPGVILNYEGIDSTTLGKRVHSLKVDYEKGAGSSGGMHTWWYYLDEQTYDLVANVLDHGKGHSLTIYESFEKVEDIRIHKKRFSHISNANKEIVYRRTIYENEDMKFNEVFEEGLFDLK